MSDIKILSARIDSSEYEVFQTNAKKQNLTPSEYLRLIVRAESNRQANIENEADQQLGLQIAIAIAMLNILAGQQDEKTRNKIKQDASQLHNFIGRKFKHHKIEG